MEGNKGKKISATYNDEEKRQSIWKVVFMVYSHRNETVEREREGEEMGENAVFSCMLTNYKIELKSIIFQKI